MSYMEPVTPRADREPSGNPFPNMVRDRDQLSRLWTHIAQVLSDGIRNKELGEAEGPVGLPAVGQSGLTRGQEADAARLQGQADAYFESEARFSDGEIDVFAPEGMPTRNTLATEFRIGDNQIAKFALGAGFNAEQAIIATAIALAESAGSTAAVGDAQLRSKKWGASIGLWQVRSLNDPLSGNRIDQMRDAMRLFDPAFNAQAAYAISRSGTKWSDWTVYNTGAYKQYLGRAQQAVRAASAVAPTEGMR